MDDVETRTVLTLRTGSKICVLIGLAFLVLCVYFLFVPITGVRTSAGAVFGCGTALNPTGGGFAHGVCGDVADENRYRAFAALAIGLLTIIVGVLMFGVDRREEHHQLSRGHHAADDDDDSRRDDWGTERRRVRRDETDEPLSDRPDDTEPRRRRRYDDARPYDDRDDERSSRRRENDDERYDDRYVTRRSISGDR